MCLVAVRGWVPLAFAGLALAMISLASLLAPAYQEPPWKTPREAFDPALAHVQTVEALEEELGRRTAGDSTKARVHALEQLIRYRFYSGYSRFGFHENWLAWLAARILHPDLDALVHVDDIMRHRAAACSQQGIVVQELLRRMGLEFATVELPGHFLTAVWIDGRWYMVDPYGPIERDRTRLFPLDYLLTEDGRNRLFLTEAERGRWTKLGYTLPRLVNRNTTPAPRARLFHALTLWASRWLWLPVLLLALAWRCVLLVRFRPTH